MDKGDDEKYSCSPPRKRRRRPERRCTICYRPNNATSRKFCCMHYHDECYIEIIQKYKRCPICKFNFKDVFVDRPAANIDQLMAHTIRELRNDMAAVMMCMSRTQREPPPQRVFEARPSPADVILEELLADPRVAGQEPPPVADPR